MKNRHRVVWTKGMFLTPQHFQTHDQFLQDAIQFRFAASQYANWGLTELNIDSEALANGLVRIVCGSPAEKTVGRFTMPPALGWKDGLASGR